MTTPAARALEARLRPLDLPCYLVAIEVTELWPRLATDRPRQR